MRFYTNINNVKANEWGLNIQQAYLFAWFYELPSWADKVIVGTETFYFASKNKALAELPLLTNKVDTIYRYYKQIEQHGLVLIKKIDGRDYISLTAKGKTWNGTKSEYSEKNPTELGKKSENNSDLNPTNNINNINKENNIYIQAQEKNEDRYISFLDYWDSYSVLVPEEKRNKKSETHIEWNKLNQEEKAKVLEYVNIVKFGKTPAKYMPSPFNVLVYKKYLSPPHEHKVFGAAAGVVGNFVGGVDEDGITEQEYKIHYSRISKEEAIRLILEGKGREIKNYSTYAFTCKKFELEQEITDDMIYHHGPRPQ
jgi:hypothetical protein